MALKMLSLHLSSPASCLSYHAEPGAPCLPIVADVNAVDVEPRVLPPHHVVAVAVVVLASNNS